MMNELSGEPLTDISDDANPSNLTYSRISPKLSSDWYDKQLRTVANGDGNCTKAEIWKIAEKILEVEGLVDVKPVGEFLTNAADYCK